MRPEPEHQLRRWQWVQVYQLASRQEQRTLPKLVDHSENDESHCGEFETTDRVSAQWVQADRSPNEEELAFQPAARFEPIMRDVCKMLEQRIQAIPGATVENNKYCVRRAASGRLTTGCLALQSSCSLILLQDS